MKRLGGIIVGLAICLPLACKPKDATLQNANTETTVQKKYEWCRPSSQALAAILDSIQEFSPSVSLKTADIWSK